MLLVDLSLKAFIIAMHVNITSLAQDISDRKKRWLKSFLNEEQTEFPTADL